MIKQTFFEKYIFDNKPLNVCINIFHIIDIPGFYTRNIIYLLIGRIQYFKVKNNMFIIFSASETNHQSF